MQDMWEEGGGGANTLLVYIARVYNCMGMPHFWEEQSFGEKLPLKKILG